MPAEYLNENGGLMQGWFCLRCGKTTNMVGSGHGPGKCEPNPELVEKLRKANK